MAKNPRLFPSDFSSDIPGVGSGPSQQAVAISNLQASSRRAAMMGSHHNRLAVLRAIARQNSTVLTIGNLMPVNIDPTASRDNDASMIILRGTYDNKIDVFDIATESRAGAGNSVTYGSRMFDCQDMMSCFIFPWSRRPITQVDFRTKTESTVSGVSQISYNAGVPFNTYTQVLQVSCNSIGPLGSTHDFLFDYKVKKQVDIGASIADMRNGVGMHDMNSGYTLSLLWQPNIFKTNLGTNITSNTGSPHGTEDTTWSRRFLSFNKEGGIYNTGSSSSSSFHSLSFSTEVVSSMGTYALPGDSRLCAIGLQLRGAYGLGGLSEHRHGFHYSSLDQSMRSLGDVFTEPQREGGAHSDRGRFA